MMTIRKTQGLSVLLACLGWEAQGWVPKQVCGVGKHRRGGGGGKAERQAREMESQAGTEKRRKVQTVLSIDKTAERQTNATEMKKEVKAGGRERHARLAGSYHGH